MNDNRQLGLFTEMFQKVSDFLKSPEDYFSDMIFPEAITVPANSDPRKAATWWMHAEEGQFRSDKDPYDVDMKFDGLNMKLIFPTEDKRDDFYGVYSTAGAKASGTHPYGLPPDNDIFAIPVNGSNELVFKKTKKAGDSGWYSSKHGADDQKWIGINFRSKKERRSFERLLSLDLLDKTQVKHFPALANTTTVYITPEVNKGGEMEG